VKVPIENVYWLLCYACGERIVSSKLDVTGVDAGPDTLPNLLAFVLARRVRVLVRRGLDRSYTQAEEETSVPRGRIDFTSTVAHCSLRKQRLVCRLDELDANVLHNQLLRTTVHMLATHTRVEKARRVELARLARLLHPVEMVRREPTLFRRVQLPRNNSRYRFLMQICEMVWLNLLPDPSDPARRSSFDAVRDDDRVMEKIFEEFIGNFYRLELSSFDVRTQVKLDWDIGKNSDTQYLPLMHADAVLRSKCTQRILIIDAKYYRDALVTSFGKDLVRSSHLYQMTAYLRSLPMKAASATAMLLYPQSGAPICLNYDLSGQKVRVRTLDLAQPWGNVHQALCDLVADIGIA
jgi:5-methylcytosine-specific restriction enzyme subunit McrC